MNSLPLPHEDDLKNFLTNPPCQEHINTGDHKCHIDHKCHDDWRHMHSINLLHSHHRQWLRVQHVEGQTGDLSSIYKSMAAGARRTETDEKGGEWRPVPLGLPQEIWAWTLPGCTDPSWTDSGHYYGVHWGIYTVDCLLEYKLLDTNFYLIFTDLTTIFSLETKKKQKARIWILLWAAHSSSVQGKEPVFLCF